MAGKKGNKEVHYGEMSGSPPEVLPPVSQNLSMSTFKGTSGVIQLLIACTDIIVYMIWIKSYIQQFRQTWMAVGLI